MDNPRQLYSLMNNAFLGFILAAAYGIVTTGVLWHVSPGELPRYPQAFFVTFNAAVVGGLISTTAILVFKSQGHIPSIIEKTFTPRELAPTDYKVYRRKYFSIVRSITFSSSCSIGAAIIFKAASLPLPHLSTVLLSLFACIHFGLSVYVGRKMFYIAQMLKAIEEIRVKKDIFSEDRLLGVSIYVNCVSTLTTIFVFASVRSLYYAPLQYSALLGSSVRAFMLIPAIMAIPIIAMFNYYPRVVVRKLYQESIKHCVRKLKHNMQQKDFSDYEKLLFILEYDKISKEELKYRLRMTLSDLPMAVTLVIAILSLVVSH